MMEGSKYHKGKLYVWIPTKSKIHETKSQRMECAGIWKYTRRKMKVGKRNGKKHSRKSWKKEKLKN